MLGKMVNGIDNEHEYLHYLTQLSQLEGQFDENEDMSEPEAAFQIIEYPTQKKGKVKSKKSRSEKAFNSVTSKNAIPSTNVLNVNFLFCRKTSYAEVLNTTTLRCNAVYLTTTEEALPIISNLYNWLKPKELTTLKIYAFQVSSFIIDNFTVTYSIYLLVKMELNFKDSWLTNYISI